MGTATILLISGMSAYAVTLLVAGAGEILRKVLLRRIGFWLLASAFLLNGWLIGWMWVDTGQPPFKTVYETLLLGAFCVGLTGWAMVWIEKLYLMIPVSALGSLICLLYACSRPDLLTALMPPPLRSGWFVPHVVTYILSYSALLISFLLALLALFKKPEAAQTGKMEPPSISLEQATVKVAVFGFVTLTLGLAMGAAWAKTAWGDYWFWDPKENWAFITWLAYLGYNHLRLLPAWRGKRALWLNLACFGIVLFTFLGQHLLPTAESSLHIYR